MPPQDPTTILLRAGWVLTEEQALRFIRSYYPSYKEGLGLASMTDMCGVIVKKHAEWATSGVKVVCGPLAADEFSSEQDPEELVRRYLPVKVSMTYDQIMFVIRSVEQRLPITPPKGDAGFTVEGLETPPPEAQGVLTEITRHSKTVAEEIHWRVIHDPAQVIDWIDEGIDLELAYKSNPRDDVSDGDGNTEAEE